MKEQVYAEKLLQRMEIFHIKKIVQLGLQFYNYMRTITSQYYINDIYSMNNSMSKRPANKYKMIRNT